VRAQLPLLLQKGVDVREASALLFQGPQTRLTQPVLYAFVKENYDALSRRLPEASRAELAVLGQGFCGPEGRADVEAFFGPRNAKAQGGPRKLANVLERVDLCIAFKQAQRASAAAFLK